jgi:hypothetical protein
MERKCAKNLQEIPINFTGIIDFVDGSIRWFKNGLLHRESGPAVEYFDGSKEWYLEGKIIFSTFPGFHFEIVHETENELCIEISGALFNVKKIPGIIPDE